MGKKGGKRKKSTGPNKLTRAQYEALTLELNRKLALLRLEVKQADDINYELRAKTHSIENDHGQVSGHLGRVIADKDEIISEMKERLIEMEKVQVEEEAETENRIRELEAKFVYEESQLTTEIRLLTLRIQSWKEYSRERKCLLQKFEVLKFKSKTREQVFKEKIYEMQQSYVVDKEQMKMEVKTSLNQLTSDCVRSTQIRQAAFARRLLRENIDLRALLQIHIKSVMKLIRKTQTCFKNQKNMVEDFDSLVQLKEHLEQVIANKQGVIVKVTEKYKSLKTAFTEIVRYTKIYGELAHDKNILQRFDWTVTSKKLRELCEKADLYKTQLNRMIAEHDEQEIEIVKFSQLIQQIEIAVQLTVDSLKEIGQYQPRVTFNAEQHDATLFKQNDLLAELIDILSSHKDSIPKTPSASSIRGLRRTYLSGSIGIVPLRPSKLENFRKDENCTSDDSDEQKSKLVCRAQHEEDWTLVDVEWGSDLYVSTDGDDT